MVFQESLWMWELDHKKSWALKNWCFWTVMLEKTLESPLNCKEIKPVHPKGNQSWIFIRRTDAEAEAPILWPLEVKKIHWKRPWCWERLKAGGEGDDRRWDCWVASLTQWTWVWAGSGSWWWTGKPHVLQSMWSQSRTRLSHWTELKNVLLGLPWWLSSEESACQCRKHEFDSWSRKILHASEQPSLCTTTELCSGVLEWHLLNPMHPGPHAPQQEKPAHCNQTRAPTHN